VIVISGATGQLGSQIVRHLLDRVSAERIGVSVRDPDRAADLAALGVRVRHGDFADPASLTEAFEGATQVLIVSAAATAEAAVALHAAACRAAHDVGARRILYTSHQAAAADSLFAPMPDHAATERYLAGTGTPFTALRNGFYASTLPWLIGAALQTGELIAPADGPVSWTTHADLAEAAAIVLADDGRFEGPTPPLTAPQAVDLDDVAGVLSELTGHPVRRVVATDDEYAAGMTAQGMPEERAAMMLGLFRAARRGEFAATGPALGDLLGRPATSVDTVLRDVVRAAAVPR
jgi:uncharacterized protein YbjT (DUF2867 family)